MICCLAALPVRAQMGGDSRMDELYGLRIHAPNDNWLFQEPDGFDVRARLKAAQEPAQMRLRSQGNIDALSDDVYITRIKTWPGYKFDNIYTSGLINGQRWYHLTGKGKDTWFSMHLRFDREQVLLLHFEAPSKELFQKYADAPRTLLNRLELDVVPRKRLGQFEALEVAIVPVGKVELGKHFAEFKETIYKHLTKKSGFKEVRATPTGVQERTALLTIRVLNFKYDPAPSPYALAPSDKYSYFGHTVEMELIFTDKETGKTFSQYQML